MCETSDFELHSNLASDGIVLGAFPLCQVLLIDDANYPWFVLVPQRPGIVELSDLSETDYQQLWQESRVFCGFLRSALRPDKLNVATLGNITPQLHVHHIARFETDAAWPKPIWGVEEAKPYTDQALSELTGLLASTQLENFTPSN
ncbi:MAG TPA: hypothetical protein DDW52_10495 [Planctomycetaceae bacterium]|nr:hypothetical protein [Planctomycetaceae bacterium]